MVVLPKRRAGYQAVRPPLTIAPLDNPTASVGALGPKEAEQEAAAEEATAAPTMAAPEQPTTQMIEAHRASGHLPFRSWCSSCVRGRGRSLAHRKQNKDQETIPTISVDFGFFGSEENPNKDNPVLVIKDRKSRAIWAHMLPSKGIDQPYGVKSLVRALTTTGYKRVIIKSDQEPAIKALVAKAIEEWHGEAVPEMSPKGESKSNGEIERELCRKSNA